MEETVVKKESYEWNQAMILHISKSWWDKSIRSTSCWGCKPLTTLNQASISHHLKTPATFGAASGPGDDVTDGWKVGTFSSVGKRGDWTIVEDGYSECSDGGGFWGFVWLWFDYLVSTFKFIFLFFMIYIYIFTHVSTKWPIDCILGGNLFKSDLLDNFIYKEQHV